MNFTDLCRLVGGNFRTLREKKDFSQEYIADKLDVGTARISEFENGKGNPTLKTIVNFAEAIEVDVEDLFDFSELHKSEEHYDRESLIKIHCNTLSQQNLKDIKYIIDTTNIFLDYLNNKQT